MKIEIMEEDGDNSLMFDNEHAHFTIDVDPATKTYRSRMSLKEDVYYRKQEYEYRIKNNPISIEIRLIERLDEPPERYFVKDGVVLEADIRENHKFRADEFIDDLKKETEWHEEWVGDPVSMYLLSKHLEIISHDDYRRYLRQVSERIKSGNQKVEEFLKTDKTGMQITDEYEMSGRTIWFPKEKQDQMSEEETNKAIEHVKKVQHRLFDKNSEEYVGISDNEFRSGKEILEHVEAFLNKKVSTKSKQNEEVSFAVKFGAFILQWVWLFIVVSFVIWLVSLVVSIVQYSFTFALVASGILAFVLISWRNSQR